jgi:hypothetical protein
MNPFLEAGGDAKIGCGLPTNEREKQVLCSIDSTEIVDIGVVKCESCRTEAE